MICVIEAYSPAVNSVTVVMYVFHAASVAARATSAKINVMIVSVRIVRRPSVENALQDLQSEIEKNLMEKRGISAAVGQHGQSVTQRGRSVVAGVCQHIDQIVDVGVNIQTDAD